MDRRRRDHHLASTSQHITPWTLRPVVGEDRPQNRSAPSWLKCRGPAEWSRRHTPSIAHCRSPTASLPAGAAVLLVVHGGPVLLGDAGRRVQVPHRPERRDLDVEAHRHGRPAADDAGAHGVARRPLARPVEVAGASAAAAPRRGCRGCPSTGPRLESRDPMSGRRPPRDRGGRQASAPTTATGPPVRCRRGGTARRAAPATRSRRATSRSSSRSSGGGSCGRSSRGSTANGFSPSRMLSAGVAMALTLGASRARVSGEPDKTALPGSAASPTAPI